MSQEGKILKFQPRTPEEKKVAFNDAKLRKFLTDITFALAQLPSPTLAHRIHAKEADASKIATTKRDIKLCSQFIDSARKLVFTTDLEIALARGVCSSEFQNMLDSQLSGVDHGASAFLQRMNSIKPYVHLPEVGHYIDELKANQLLLQQAVEGLKSKLRPQ